MLISKTKSKLIGKSINVRLSQEAHGGAATQVRQSVLRHLLVHRCGESLLMQERWFITTWTKYINHPKHENRQTISFWIHYAAANFTVCAERISFDFIVSAFHTSTTTSDIRAQQERKDFLTVWNFSWDSCVLLAVKWMILDAGFRSAAAVMGSMITMYVTGKWVGCICSLDPNRTHIGTLRGSVWCQIGFEVRWRHQRNTWIKNTEASWKSFMSLRKFTEGFVLFLA